MAKKRNDLYSDMNFGICVPNDSPMQSPVFWDIYARLKELAINMFRWDGLPDTCDQRFLELALFDKGMALFFENDNGYPYCLQCTVGGNRTIYNIPIERTGYAVTGAQFFRNDLNSVIIWNNYLHTPTYNTIVMFAYRLMRIQLTIDINLNAINQPVVMRGTKAQITSLENAYDKFTGLKPVMFVDETIADNTFSCVQTGAQYYVDKLRKEYMDVWNEALTFIGINNSNTEKRERLITDEVNSNNNHVSASRAIMLQARQEACEQIRKLFGYDINVALNPDYNTPTPEMGVTDDELYDPAD